MVFQTPEVIEDMNDWCKKTHGESGLTALIPSGTPLGVVEKEILALIERHFASNERIVLCGNSVGNDKRFVDRYLPDVAKRLHYRLIDVSSFKEVFREHYGVNFQKQNAHRAIDDVLESIRELSHYLSFVKIPDAAASAASANLVGGGSVTDPNARAFRRSTSSSPRSWPSARPAGACKSAR